MIHRHLELPAGASVAELPVAALHDLLDRGDLEDWRPILVAIEEAPHGTVAERVARLVDAYPMYGTSPLLRAWIERCRNRESALGSTAGQLDLATVRLGLGLTQAEVAKRVGITQSDYSKLERRRDWRVSTLAAVARALGGRLRVWLSFSDRSVELGVETGSRRNRAV